MNLYGFDFGDNKEAFKRFNEENGVAEILIEVSYNIHNFLKGCSSRSHTVTLTHLTSLPLIQKRIFIKSMKLFSQNLKRVIKKHVVYINFRKQMNSLFVP